MARAWAHFENHYLIFNSILINLIICLHTQLQVFFTIDYLNVNDAISIWINVRCFFIYVSFAPLDISFPVQLDSIWKNTKSKPGWSCEWMRFCNVETFRTMLKLTFMVSLSKREFQFSVDLCQYQTLAILLSIISVKKRSEKSMQTKQKQRSNIFSNI